MSLYAYIWMKCSLCYIASHWVPQVNSLWFNSLFTVMTLKAGMRKKPNFRNRPVLRSYFELLLHTNAIYLATSILLTFFCAAKSHIWYYSAWSHSRHQPWSHWLLKVNASFHHVAFRALLFFLNNMIHFKSVMSTTKEAFYFSLNLLMMPLG